MSAPANIRPVPNEPQDASGRHLEENLREAADLSLAMFMLMTGLCSRGYPYAVGKEELAALCQLATEVRDRAVSANEQWLEDSQQ
jgi:hypothetical protein